MSEPVKLPLISHQLVLGRDRAAARAMLRAVGLQDDDFGRPLIGIANTWTDTTPCNAHLRDLGAWVKEGVREAGGVALEFNTIAVSDGITMGTSGMTASLVSREVVADSIELLGRAYFFDGIVALSGCDKTIPGTVMALARLNRPSLMLYGGSIQPGRHDGKDVTIQDVFEGIGACAAGRITQAELDSLERDACPGAGACGGQFTANTMATVFETMGISPMGSGSVPAIDPAKEGVARECGRLVMEMVESGLKAGDLITRKSLENGIAAAVATGGSTNSVLHLLALAHESGVELGIRDFDEISARTPLIADLKPGGRFVATDLHQAGGVALVLRRLLEAGLLHGDALTVTGRTLAEEVKDAPEAPNKEFWLPFYSEEIKRLDRQGLVRRYLLTSDLVESYDWTPQSDDAWTGPVTILLSRKDAMVGSKMRTALSALYPDADTHVFQTEGHGLYVYDPVGFSQTVASALESQARSRP